MLLAGIRQRPARHPGVELCAPGIRAVQPDGDSTGFKFVMARVAFMMAECRSCCSGVASQWLRHDGAGGAGRKPDADAGSLPRTRHRTM